ncbi:MAG: hypothetical protein HYZ79_02880 [Candidatus Melainabacteria bacterium]|nr:hypothetical protein [Candidatus Melainabacteria bacterium]
MLADDKKYLTEILKIGGFALMTPLGKVVLNLSGFEMFELSIRSLGILSFLMLLFYFGILMLYHGYITVRNK